jgi:hypothetical protein
LPVSLPNSADARFVPAGVRAETICGSSNSSVIALPSAIRSGQKATSISRPSLVIIFSTSAVTPGNTVLRRTSNCPSLRNSEQPPSALVMAICLGFRCSSTGVPMTTITCSAVATIAGSADASRRPAPSIRLSTSSAPDSANGIRPELTVATAASLTS